MSEFSAPDFSVPPLSTSDLTMPDFTMPDASLPDPPTAILTQPIIPADLDLLAGSASPHPDPEHSVSGSLLAMPETSSLSQMSQLSQLSQNHVSQVSRTSQLSQNQDMAYDPTQQMPGTLDNSALPLLASSLDNRQLPGGLSFDTLHTTPDMSTRERHLGMLLLGLEGKGPEGLGQ